MFNTVSNEIPVIIEVQIVHCWLLLTLDRRRVFFSMEKGDLGEDGVDEPRKVLGLFVLHWSLGLGVTILLAALFSIWEVLQLMRGVVGSLRVYRGFEFDWLSRLDVMTSLFSLGIDLQNAFLQPVPIFWKGSGKVMEMKRWTDWLIWVCCTKF